MWNILLKEYKEGDLITIKNKSSVKQCRDYMFRIVKDGCIECISHKKDGRYVRVRFDGKYRTLHRLIYENTIEQKKCEYTVRHICKNTSCVNPKHLKTYDK